MRQRRRRSSRLSTRQNSRSDRPLRVLRVRRWSVLVMLRLGRLGPLGRSVLVTWRGRRIRGPESNHRRSEQPHQSAPTPCALGVLIHALTEGSNGGSIFAVGTINGRALPLSNSPNLACPICL